MNDEQIRDFLEMGSISKPNKKPPKLPLTPAQLKEQMDNWKGVVEPRQYPHHFDDKETFDRFGDDVNALVGQFRMPPGKLVVQGSSLRNPQAKDVDVALFVSDADFDAYAAQCRKGILARAANPQAAQSIVQQLDDYAARGFLPKFLLDRVDPTKSFGSEARSKLEGPFEITLDFSVMKKSASVALYPSMELKR
jgi:hypothetical protein